MNNFSWTLLIVLCFALGGTLCPLGAVEKNFGAKSQTPAEAPEVSDVENPTEESGDSAAPTPESTPASPAKTSAPKKKTPKGTLKIKDITPPETPPDKVVVESTKPKRSGTNIHINKKVEDKELQKILNRNKPKEDPIKKKAEKIYLKALDLEQKGKYSKAAAEYEKVNAVISGYRGGEVFDRLEGYTGLLRAEERIADSRNKAPFERAAAYLALARACDEKSRLHFAKTDAIQKRVEKGIAEESQIQLTKSLGAIWRKRAKLAAALALQQEPNNPKAQELLGELIEREKNYADRLAYYQDLQEMNPRNYRALIKESETLASRLKFREALGPALRAMQVNPSLPDAYFQAGSCYQELNQLVSAQLYYQRAVEVESRFVAARFRLGEVCFLRQRWDDAIAQFNAAEKLNPEPFPMLNYLRGRCFLEKGQLESAEQDFRSAITLKGRADLCHYQIGEIYFRQGKFKDGFSEMDLALKFNDDLQEAHDRLAYFYMNCSLENLRDYSKAVVHANRAAMLTGYNYGPYLVTLAEAQFANDDPEGALQTAERALKLPTLTNRQEFEALKKKYQAFVKKTPAPEKPNK